MATMATNSRVNGMTAMLGMTGGHVRIAETGVILLHRPGTAVAGPCVLGGDLHRAYWLVGVFFVLVHKQLRSPTTLLYPYGV